MSTLTLTAVATLIEKSGEVRPVTLKNVPADQLYKKAGFKTADDFALRHKWSFPQHEVWVYAKDQGRANMENKYEFPAPLDQTLFFGSCLVVGMQSGGKKAIDLPPDTWQPLAEQLHGGFEDLGDDDHEEEEEEPDEEAEELTKEGYVKDGFVVEDDEVVAAAGAESSEEEDSFATLPEEEDEDVEMLLESDDDDFVAELQEEEYDYDAEDPRLKNT